MPTCPKCGESTSWLSARANGLCQACYSQRPRKQQPGEVEVETAAELEAILLSTEVAPQGLKVSRRLGIVSGECVLGMNVFKDLMAGARDAWGGRSETLQNGLRDARAAAFDTLRQQAFERGANAVIAISLDYSEISTGSRMLMVVATGTAVDVEEDRAQAGLSMETPSPDST